MKVLWYRRAMVQAGIEPIGKRIARLRSLHGYTQQSLAVRLAISRVAVSHIEMDISLPSERTITLLAGIFKISPVQLVEGTTYPAAKVDRLPSIANAYTPLEYALALFSNDLEWLEKIPIETHQALRGKVIQRWTMRFSELESSYLDEEELTQLEEAKIRLANLA